MKNIIKIILIIVAIIVLFVGIYVAYVFLSYHRIEDNQSAEVKNPDGVSDSIATGSELSITSWNIGFGAYLQDYSFFMDGGEESRARSEEILMTNMDDINVTLDKFGSDLFLIQEVDLDGTRSYHVNEAQIISDHFSGMASTFAQNYDSPYLFYPVTKPHGANKSSILTLSNTEITSSLRRSLPIQSGFMKILDLDRCINVTRIPADNGKELVLINAHLSAYTTDPKVNVKQLKIIYDIMQSEYEEGNYVICGGDFNKDLLGNSTEVFPSEASPETANWCQPFPFDGIPEGISLIAAFDEGNKVPSCRNTDIGYEEGKTFICTVDGFLVTRNVEVVSAKVQDEKFMCSDHNPVTMQFILKNED